MIITLNLISPEQRQNLRRRLAIDELRSLGSTMLLMAILISSLLLGVKYLLRNTADLFQNNTQPLYQATEIKTEDKNILKLVSTQLKRSPQWSNILIQLSQLVPTGINLNTIDVDINGSLRLTGHAKERPQLMEFQKNLTSSSLVKNLYSPVKNLLQPKNIDWEMSAQLTNWEPVATTTTKATK